MLRFDTPEEAAQFGGQLESFGDNLEMFASFTETPIDDNGAAWLSAVGEAIKNSPKLQKQLAGAL